MPAKRLQQRICFNYRGEWNHEKISTLNTVFLNLSTGNGNDLTFLGFSREWNAEKKV